MLDVHPPDERIHGFRDFLLHLFTITVGLLIALSLEGSVEWWHHRHLREEADAKMSQEIRDNVTELSTTRSAITKERESLIGVLKFLEARASNQPYDIHGISLSFNIGSLQDSSWRTAAATGALGYMEYPHVQRFAAAYQLQDEFSRVQQLTLEEFLRLQAYVVFGFDPKKLSASDAQLASADVRRTLAHLVAMDQIGAGLDKTYKAALVDPGH